jgi:PAS domain-containing protein
MVLGSLLKAAVARKTRELEAKTVHLEESEERFRALFENTVQPIALTDEDVSSLPMQRLDHAPHGET